MRPILYAAAILICAGGSLPAFAQAPPPPADAAAPPTQHPPTQHPPRRRTPSRCIITALITATQRIIMPWQHRPARPIRRRKRRTT